MNDEPLFQNTDAQEQIYAPDQRAPGDPARRTPTDELGAGGDGGTGAGGSGAASTRETGLGGSGTGNSNRQMNDASGQTGSG